MRREKPQNWCVGCVSFSFKGDFFCTKNILRNEDNVLPELTVLDSASTHSTLRRRPSSKSSVLTGVPLLFSLDLLTGTVVVEMLCRLAGVVVTGSDVELLDDVSREAAPATAVEVVVVDDVAEVDDSFAPDVTGDPLWELPFSAALLLFVPPEQALLL